MEQLYVQVYDVDVEWEDEETLEDLVDYGYKEDKIEDRFRYEPDEVYEKLNFDRSYSFCWDIENEEELTKNALIFLWK